MTHLPDPATAAADPVRRALSASDRVGLFGLAAFAFFGPIGATGMQSGLALMLLAMLAQWGEFRRFWRSEPLAWLSLAAIAYVVARALWLLFVADGTGGFDEFRDTLGDYLGLSGALALVVVWWLARPGSSAGWVLGLVALGFVLDVLRHSDPEAIRGYMAGSRAVFGKSLNGPGLLSATVLIGLVGVVLPRLLSRSWISSLRRLLAWGAFVCVFAINLAALVWNQSRAAWAATAVGFGVVGVYRAYDAVRNKGFGLRGTLVAALLLAAALAAWLGAGRDLVTQRTAGDGAVIEAVLAGDWDEIPDTSLGFRIQLWSEASRLTGEQPLLGWGPGSSDELIETLTLTQHFPHFHNMVLQLLVENGIVGLVLFGAVLVAMLMRFVAGARRGSEPADYLVFTAVLVMVYLAVSLVQIHYTNSYGMFYIILLGALMLRPWVRWRRETGA